VFLNGDAIAEPDGRGNRVADDSFLLFFNGHHEDMDFTVPREVYGERWETVLDTAAPLVVDRPTAKAGDAVPLEARSILLLRRVV
jgi:glycogen operon protein